MGQRVVGIHSYGIAKCRLGIIPAALFVERSAQVVAEVGVFGIGFKSPLVSRLGFAWTAGV